MFSNNLRFLSLEHSRKDTLMLVLHLIRQCSDHGICFTSDIFRDAVFFGQTTDGKTIFDFDLKGFHDIVARWRLFQLHEYMTYAMESLLHVLLTELKKKDEGLSFDDFLGLVGDTNTSISAVLGIKPTDTIKQAIDSILGKYQLGSLNEKTSRQFDGSCTIRKTVSEKGLFDHLQNAIKKNGLHETISYAAAILILNYIRSFHLLDSIDQVTLWFTSRALPELSPISFAYEIKGKVSTWTMNDLVRYCFRTVRDQHNSIALDKLLYGNDTYRFEEKGNLLKFKMDIYSNYPSYRGSKIESVLSILEQLGLVGSHENVESLTPDGERVLREWLRERVS